MTLSGLEGVGRCEPGECTSHRNHHSDRRFLFRPTQDKREERVGKGQLYYAENGSFRNVSGDSSLVNQRVIQHANSADISGQRIVFERDARAHPCSVTSKNFPPPICHSKHNQTFTDIYLPQICAL